VTDAINMALLWKKTFVIYETTSGHRCDLNNSGATLHIDERTQFCLRHGRRPDAFLM
jgi:hypothetical protein